MKIPTWLIRLSLSGWMLWIVFHHAHWSVAAFLTLVMISDEGHVLLFRDIFKRLKKLDGGGK